MNAEERGREAAVARLFRRARSFLYRNPILVLFFGVFAVFAFLSPRFADPRNLTNILIQSSSAAIVATGMTCVLLTAGIDLSVGSIMFVTAAITGKMMLSGWPLWVCLPAVALAGLLYGGVNALFIARLRMIPFMVTLATLYLGRGLALWISETRAMNLPESFLRIGTARLFGWMPAPVFVAAGVVAAAHLMLARTMFGRQVYAVGYSPDIATKAGINADGVVARVYLISALCAVVGGIVSVAQLGAVSPTFGSQREFAAIAASVLGGTSLFGGRGAVFPGTVLGALLIQMVENGLVIVHADPYIYPMITASIIFFAVLLDCLRQRSAARVSGRVIRVASTDG